MGVVAVNEKDVKLVKSGHGKTKWLVPSKNGAPAPPSIMKTKKSSTPMSASPERMIRHWGPDTDIPVHSHPYHEMFYVLEGEIEIGGTTYTAGSCIYVEKGTPYGPTRAPKGGKVLRYAEAGPSK